VALVCALTVNAARVGAQSGQLPTPWLNRDIGGPALTGSASVLGDTFTVTGGGVDIYNTNDEFHFVYQPWQGNVEIVARLSSLEERDPSSKAGVMIRETLTGGSTHGMMLGSSANGWGFLRRFQTGNETPPGVGLSGSLPGWVRLVREGNVLTGYLSMDGQTWTVVGTDTIPMASSVYVGLAVTSHNPGFTSTATFTNVTISTPGGSANKPPTVALISPAPGSTYVVPATISLAAAASDPDGTITKVDFYQGAQLVVSDSTYPYSAKLRTRATGTLQLTAVATDSQGRAVTSSPVSVTVNARKNDAPTVSLTSPSAGATFTAPASITIGAAASDTDGTVSVVDFYQGSTLIGSDATSPYSMTWGSVAAGSYQLTAIARDNVGAPTTSAAVAVTVNAAANQPPSVTLTSPAAGASFAAPANVTLNATASDTDGTVSRVEFYRGSTLIGSDTTGPYSIVWGGATAGSYSVTARAVDNGGATRTSTPVAITVTTASNQLPAVSITSPTAGQSFSAPASLTVAATATDADGTIAGVDFYVGTQLVGTDSTSPYTASWSNVAAGSYSLTAVARDNAGGTRTSTAVAVTVTGTAAGLPAPWANQDIGGPALAGSTLLSGTTFTVTGAGVDIFGTKDEFQFAYQPAQGDVEIVARVASLQQSDPWSKAGVMIRETLTGGSRFGLMHGSSANGWRFQRRLQTDGATTSAGPAGPIPGWVRLVRLGTLVTSYQSADGVTWTVVGSDTIPMASAVYVGLAVTSHNPSATSAATFTNVTVSVPTGTPNQPPTVSLTGPAVGTSFTAPATISMTATASDMDGTVSRVDFYQGSTLIGSDSTSPFSVAWTGAPAGSYSLSARAVDDDGATSTSTAVAVTVTAASNQMPTVAITSPIAGQSFTAPASLTITAAASDPDGTITGVDFYAGTQLIAGDATSPYTAAWNNVAAGSYSLTAVARDNAGGTRTSGAVAVTISATASSPTTLIFGASADHATNVTSYIVAIYRAADPVTASPVATRDIGKPTPVNGDISVDISTLVNPLPAGSYYAVVRATGPGGTTASAPSATFTR
jgi:regulation of enolase protein 1 (concanavalin A-like superfamily)